MKDFDTIVAESCIKAEEWEKDHNRPFDRTSFFIGYSHCVHDIIKGRLLVVELAAAEERMKKLIKEAKKRRG